MDELIEYIKAKKGKISWSSNFIGSYLDYINEEYIKLKMDTRGEYIYYLYHNNRLPNSICECGSKKKFNSFKNPYRKYCSSKCANNYSMTEEKKKKISIIAKENYNNFSEKKKEMMVAKQKESFKKNWTEEDSKRYSKIMKERHRNLTEEEKEKRAKKISASLKKSLKAKVQRIKRSKLVAAALREYIKSLKDSELKAFKKKLREKNGIKDEERHLFKNYKKLAWYYTNKNLEEIENIELRSMHMHLDHKFSILEGFKQGISPEIIGSNLNLEILEAKINCSKQDKCSITKEVLISSFEKLIGD